jgi:hypothetical protein
MHRVVLEPDGTVTLYVGADNWPSPIPIVKDSSGKWYFDTDAGMKEILYRRVGTNENDAIDTLHTLGEAQREYASQARGGSKNKQYALKFVSTAGQQDGLYWKTDDNQPPSPIGPLIADASSQGYAAEQGKATPFPWLLLPNFDEASILTGKMFRATTCSLWRPIPTLIAMHCFVLHCARTIWA